MMMGADRENATAFAQDHSIMLLTRAKTGFSARVATDRCMRKYSTEHEVGSSPYLMDYMFYR